eukprot:927078_1
MVEENDVVELTKNRIGTVRYKGPLDGKMGIFYGVELTKGSGKHSGLYKGRRYFMCKRLKGVFVDQKQIISKINKGPKDDKKSKKKTTQSSASSKSKPAKKTGPRDEKKKKKDKSGWKPPSWTKEALEDDGGLFLEERKRHRGTWGKAEYDKAGYLPHAKLGKKDHARFQAEIQEINDEASKIEAERQRAQWEQDGLDRQRAQMDAKPCKEAQENDEIVSLFSEKEIIDMQQLLPFIWSMTEMQLQWIKECQIKEEFVSDSFKINEALFVLVFVPRQETSKSSLHLKLLQLPNNLNGIVINVTTKCKPLSASDSKIFDASYSRDRSSNLLQISFDDFKHHLFTNTDLFNVFECDFKVLKVYPDKTDTPISRNVHPFQWNLKPAQVQYFLESNEGEVKFTLNTAGNEWSLTLKWDLEQQSDDEETKQQSARVDVKIEKRGDNELAARMWMRCDGISFGNISENTFSNKWRYSWCNYLRIHKNRFLGLNDMKFHGFVEVMDNELDSVKLKTPQFDGKFEWDVSTQSLQVFNNAWKDEPFWSNPFEIGGCVWTLHIYPKGRKGSDQVAVQLCLLGLPSNVEEVIVRMNVKLNEFDDTEFIHRFNYDHDRVYFPILSIEKFISLELFRLLCSIEIISMDSSIDKEQKKYDVVNEENPNEFELNLTPDELEIFYNPELTGKKYAVFRYFWLHGIKWQLVCYPNGNDDDDDSMGYVMVYLYIVEYPPDVTGVKSRYWITCNEGMFGCASGHLWEKKKVKTGYGWEQKLKHSRFEELRDAEQLNGVSFLCHIDILDSFSTPTEPTPKGPKGELECKECELLVIENRTLREKNKELLYLNKNMMNGLDQLLLNQTNRQPSHTEGDLVTLTQRKPMIDLWNDKISQIANEKQRVKKEMEELRQRNDTLQKLQDESAMDAFSTEDGVDDTALTTRNGTQVSEPCAQCKLVGDAKESLQNDNDKLKQRLKEIESKQEEDDEHEMKGDENEALLQHVLDECENMRREQQEFKAKEKQLQNELNEKEKTIKTLSDSYDLMMQQMRNEDDEKAKESKDELKSFLSSRKYRVDLMDLYHLFKEEGFDDFEMFSELTDNDLNDIGIRKKAHRMKILRGIRIWETSQNHINDDQKTEGSHTTKMFILD